MGSKHSLSQGQAFPCPQASPPQPLIPSPPLQFSGWGLVLSLVLNHLCFV